MQKLNRERKLRERRIDKQAKKDARKRAAEDPQTPLDGELESDTGEPTAPPSESTPIE